MTPKKRPDSRLCFNAVIAKEDDETFICRVVFDLLDGLDEEEIAHEEIFEDRADAIRCVNAWMELLNPFSLKILTLNNEYPQQKVEKWVEYWAGDNANV